MAKEMKFEDALERLEEILEKLESGEVDLDGALKLYEEGVELLNFCNKKLNETKMKIEILKKEQIQIPKIPAVEEEFLEEEDEEIES